MQLWMETEGGVAISYASTFSSRNGGHFAEESYQFEGELGTLFSETNYTDPPLLLSRRGDEEPIDLTADVEIRDSAGQYALADRAILENLRAAVVDGTPLLCSGADNVRSLAVVEAARRCLHEGRPVRPADCLAEASC
jgi:predicted dehydrogenase